MTVLPRLSLNQATVSKLSLTEAVDLCGRHDIPAIGLSREQVTQAGVRAAAAAVRAAGLRVSSLTGGGLFTDATSAGRGAAVAQTKAAIADAAALEAGTLILTCGGLVPGRSDLGMARRLIATAVKQLVPVAQASGVRLGIEPYHPLFAADRCVITRLGEALDLAEQFPADAVGVVVDTYHLWWDAALLTDIARAGERIAAYQVSDWVLPLPADAYLGRGHVGDGCIDFPPITKAVTEAGYSGDIEVEVLSDAVWSAPADQTAATIRGRFPQIA